MCAQASTNLLHFIRMGEMTEAYLQLLEDEAAVEEDRELRSGVGHEALGGPCPARDALSYVLRFVTNGAGRS